MTAFADLQTAVTRARKALRADSPNIKSLLASQADLAHAAKVCALDVDDGQEMTGSDRQLLSAARDVSTELGTAISIARAALEVQRARAAAAPMDPNQRRVIEDNVRAGHPRPEIDGSPSGRVRRPGEPLSYRSLFGVQAEDSGGWQHSAEYFQVIAQGLNDPRLVPLAAGQGGESGPHGGFALPSSIEMRIFNGAVPRSIFLSRANVQPMTTRTADVVTFDRSQDGANGTVFGFGFEFLPEGGSGASIQTAELRQISMTARTAAILFDASNELLSDQAAFEDKLLEAVSLAAGYGIDRYCLRGTGAAQPLGLLNMPSVITVPKKTGQSAATIVYQNLTEMFARLPVSSVQSSVWLASPSTIPALSTLEIAVGTGGTHVPVMTQQDGGFMILTRPVIFTDLCPPLGSLGDITLVDLSQYTVGMRTGMAIDRSQHVGFAKNRTTFRLLLRFDGGSGWSEPYQPEHSAPTQSPFLTLAARA